MIACTEPPKLVEILFLVVGHLMDPSTHPKGNIMAIIEHKKSRAEKNKVGLHEGQKVTLLISHRTEMGFVAVINGSHKGILYENEVFQPLKTGQEIDGYIKKVRDDEKIDLCLQKPGYKAIDVLC